MSTRKTIPVTNGDSTHAGAMPAQPEPDETPRLSDLAAVALDALKLSPPRYVAAIFGLPRSWLPPFRRYSEYTMASPWRPLRTLKYLQNTWLPTVPRTPPAFTPPLLNDFFWQPSVILQRPDHNGSYTTFLDESWFFINGIMTNDAVAQLNAALLAELFHRPITLIQNSTGSLLVDLLQCALDKEGWRVTEPVTKAFPAIYDALKDPNKARVVVIAHSQGTLIAGVVLKLLKQLTRMAPPPTPALAPEAAAACAPPEFVYPAEGPLVLSEFAPLSEQELGKLELYCFATCANVMTPLRAATVQRRAVPHLEHFANEHDVVARLGMLAPAPAEHGLHITGARYVRPGAYGHLLNEHYLYPILDAQRQGRRRGGRGTAAPFVPVEADAAAPQLFGYINGGR